MRLFLSNIKQLVLGHKEKVGGAQMANLPALENAYLVAEDGIVTGMGNMADLPNEHADQTIDCTGRLVLPAFCDSHTHIVFAGDRSNELALKVKGLTYQEIAARGGGIMSTVKAVREADEKELYDESARRVEEVISTGTGAIEIKSGYGLNLESELKMLRVARRIKENFPIDVKTTFLAAHTIPPAFKGNKAGYINHIIQNMLPQVREEGLADYIDVFCEEGYFTVDEMSQLIEAGDRNNLKAKVHVNQFTALGGVAAAVYSKALSVDHLEELTEDDVLALQDSDTIPVALPGCSFYLDIPYTPGRKLIDAGLPLAVASDYNPGSSPSGNLQFVLSLASLKMKLTPEEAINALTINGAAAMELDNKLGSISIGKKANFIITSKLNTYAGLPYKYNAPWTYQVWLNGRSFY